MRLKFWRKKQKHEKCEKHSKRNFKTYGKRAVSLLLCAGMVIPSLTGLSVKAAEVPPTYLKSSRISADNLPAGDVLYFGTAGAKVKEKGSYAVKVYRDGDDIEKKASVELRTVDMTAVYGQDYELLMENVSETGDGKSLLEKYSVGSQKKSDIIEPALSDDSIFEEEIIKLQDVSSKTDGENASEDSGSKTDSETASEDGESKADSETASEDGETKKASSVSTLAKEKEEQTGSETRELVESEESSIAESLQASLMGSAMEDMEYSSVCKLDFAAGEREKTVIFKIIEDDESEGTEGFTLMLANPTDTEVYEVGTSSISIEDNDKKVKSEISFTEKNYKSKNGKATLTVKRTGAEQSVCDMTIVTSGITAKAGTNYAEKNEELAFAPYETEKKIEMDVAGEGEFKVILKDFKGCKEGKNTEAFVEIVKENEDKDKADADSDKPESSKADSSGKTGSASALKKVKKAASGSSKEFTITIYGKDYTVRYNEGDVTGKIVDTGYDIELEVGTYYFANDTSNGGMFTYSTDNRTGDNPSTKKCTYNAGSPGYGRIEWYDWRTWRKGQIWTQSTRTIPGVYYQYFVPDWESTSSFGGGQKQKLEIIGDSASEKKEGGSFGRTQSRGAVDNMKDEKLQAKVYAIDEEKNKTPKNYINFYGICAMYRKFNISVLPYPDMQFLDGTRNKISAQPVAVSVECGAKSLTNSNTHDIYANMDAEQSNIVFKTENGMVNNVSDIYA
ncbi:MAG: hypothetical protein NC347_15855, partial [Clostridium sp.]|nr:hypothetical protein [Clostridium sp.]